jgi:iron(III) transport system substrate-binding protein
LFEPCITIEDARLPADFQGQGKLWVGESPAPVVIVYNSILVEPEMVPGGWGDLLDPKWKGTIAFANPTRSGSAYTLLCTMITAMGGPDGGGWEFIRQFVENLDGKILDNSSDAYALVSKGEYCIGLTQEKSASTAKRLGASIDISYPEEGTSAVPDAIAVVKGAASPDLAKRFIDFILGYDNQHVMATLFNRRPIRRDLPPPEGLPPMEEIALIEYDLSWAAESKAAILSMWSELAGGRQ